MEDENKNIKNKPKSTLYDRIIGFMLSLLETRNYRLVLHKKLQHKNKKM